MNSSTPAEPILVFDDAAVAFLARRLPIWIWVYDLYKRQSIFSNDQVIIELGYTPQEIHDMADSFLESIMHPDDVANVQEHVARCLALKDDETADFQVRFRDTSGEYHFLHHRVRVYQRDETGAPRWVFGAATDISALAEAQEKHRFQSGILQQVSDAIVAIDKDSNVIYWNTAAEKLYGASNEEIIGKPLSEAYTFEWQSEEEKIEAERALKEEGAWQGRNVHVLRNGERRYVESMISLLLDAKGRPVGTLASIRDITERRKLADEVTKAQNLESLGLLAGGVSHGFNNILAAILGYAEVMHSKLPEDDPNRNLLTQIIRSGERGASLTHQLLAFARRRTVEMREIDINENLRGSTLMLSALLRTNVEIVLELQPDLWKVKADAAHLEQVLINLALNAKDAMPNGGTLTIGTKNVNIEKNHGHLPAEMPPGDYALLTVTDTGHGMEKTVKERAFEPFFTTKEIGKGTGLGLATSYGLITQAGGYMNVESEPGKGATFKIYLPRA